MTTFSAPRAAARATGQGRRRLGSAVCLLLALGLVRTDPVEGAGTPLTERVAPSRPILTVTDGRLTARLGDAPLERVLDALADATGARFDVDALPGERVTGELIDLPIEESLRRLLRGRQVIIVYEQFPDGPARLAAVRAYGDSASSARGRPDRESAAVSSSRAPVGTPDTMPDLPADRDTLVRVLSTTPDGTVRQSAAEQLGGLDGDGIEPALGRALADADPDVRQSAARALGRTWDEGAIEPLATALRDDGDTAVREAAAQALGQLWSERAADALSVALVTDPSRAVREAAARALGDIGDARGVAALIAALRDPRGSVREVAVGALGAIGSTPALAALGEAAVADRDPWVRAEAAAALEESAE